MDIGRGKAGTMAEGTNGSNGNSVKNIYSCNPVSVEQLYRYREREGWDRGSEQTNGSRGNSIKNICPVTL
jgi:hypothetical protein